MTQIVGKSEAHISHDLTMSMIDASGPINISFAHTSRQSDGFIAKETAIVVYAGVCNPDNLWKISYHVYNSSNSKFQHADLAIAF